LVSTERPHATATWMETGPEKRLHTLVQPEAANHSFSGVSSDLQSVCLEDVIVFGLVIGEHACAVVISC
jgi:hypothetical protein